ncbi:hypothetical protein AB0C27_11710 [Nonomuraea sp. NPDC048882]
MTFTQLRILQAVARTGDMTRAAEELAMALTPRPGRAEGTGPGRDLAQK